MPLLPPFPIPFSNGDAGRRLGAVDAARGVALLAMAVYHTSWDLDFLGLASLPLLTDPLWLAARTVILSSFLLLAGVGLALAAEHGLDRRRFLRRVGLLVLAAAAVSAVSYALFPDSPIFFGVLHHIAVASVLGAVLLRLPWPVLLVLGGAVIAVGRTVALPLFDTPALRWVGLMTFEPDSNDYVPLFPWFGVVLVGMALARLRLGLGRPARAGVPRNALGRGFAWAGRHSLAIYLIHQPLIYGALSLAALGIGVDPPDVRNFLDACSANCQSAGGTAAQCTANCRCVVNGLDRAGLWDRFLADRLDAAGRSTLDRTLLSCQSGGGAK